MSLKPKLLCVDDEPDILIALERLFKSHFEVLTAPSPAKALELIAEHPDTAVVLSDFRMPEMNGVELLQQIRVLAPLTSRAILSGHIDIQQISTAINHADIHKFFLKPWENDYLTLQMLSALQVHRTLRERAHYQQLALTDPVTDLTNHRYFQDRLRADLEYARKNSEPLSLAIFDVDHFKSFNDRFGHPEGDRLLFGVAQRLRHSTAGRGSVSRYGGEEFTLILPGLDQDSAFGLVDQIRKDFERTHFTGPLSSPAFITLSAGLASFPESGDEAPALIEAADRALYQAKRQGRNQVATAGRSR
ncbi:MAG TPA: diguanylate cyclase [Bdellovibrionales bacterium]|nr:diguanylate cyclase [Bdellovibrionales bacterium]